MESTQPTVLPFILAGGSGTRLWPLSRQAFPKQFVTLTGDLSLFQQALLRVKGQGFLPPAILGHEDHRFLLAEHARAADVTPSSIILEPALRDTAPAACIAALKASQISADQLILLMPCDHLISQAELFRATILKGAAAASGGAIVVYGVVPTFPHDGFGYIECPDAVRPEDNDPIPVTRFVEKPKRETAEEYLRTGRFLWNAGIFLFRAGTMVEAFRKLAPDVLKSCEAALKESRTDLDFIRLQAAAYSAAPKISLDYAIIEKTRGMLCVPLRTDWSDCGTWASVQDVLARDAQGNIFHGDVTDTGSTDTLAYNTGSACVVTIGLESVITVVTDDAVLVANKSHAGELKSVVERMAAAGREQSIAHRRVYRPWGWYEGIAFGPRYQVKCILVKPGAKLSLQSHHHRAEHWIVVSGLIEVTCNDKVFLLGEDESTYIPVNARHRMSNPGKIPAVLIEVQSGSYVGEDDIIRYEDVYGRLTPT